MRTHYCGQVNESLLDKEVQLAGWVHRRRDHGGVIFVDLRDREGLVQVVFDPDRAAMFAEAEHLRNEFVISVKGKVRHRPKGTENPNLASGKVEVLALSMEILNRSETPPFMLDEEDVNEERRLKYRYIDLRRHVMQGRLKMRAQIARTLRSYLDTQGFIELETPMLTRATPEGARDYLVPSRTHPGKFFALPQSPQLFKQLLMMSGMDRYYQIVRCFRDEDLRADRQPEFTQLDIETSFLDEQGITVIMEDLIRDLFKQVLNVNLPTPFPRLTYAEAMRRYGSDKPDLRISLELTEVTHAVKDVAFKVFSGPATSGGRVAALRIPNGASLTRGEIDGYTEFVKIYGAKGLAYIKVNDVTQLNETGLQSPIVKNLHEAALKAIIEHTGAQNGDLIFFGADKTKIVNDALGALRSKIGHEKGYVNGKAWEPLWVVDFPMFEYDEEEKRWTACHHPFTSPKDEHLEFLESDPGRCLAKAYDLALNC